MYRRHSKGKGHGDGSDGDGEFKDSDDSAACWRAAVDAFRDALHGQAAAALPAPLLAYLNSGAFGERCGAVLGPDAAASLLPAAELSGIYNIIADEERERGRIETRRPARDINRVAQEPGSDACVRGG